MNDLLMDTILGKAPQIIAELIEGKASSAVADLETPDGETHTVYIQLLPGVRHSDLELSIPVEARHLNDNTIEYFVFYDPEKPDGLSVKTGGEVRSRVPEEIRLLGLESKELYSIEIRFHPEEDQAA
jgi:hypothetical protein